MVEGKEEEPITRLLEHAMAKRTIAVSQIRGIHAMALRVKDEPELAAKFGVNAADLYGAWTMFKVEHDSVLECCVKLKRMESFAPDLHYEVQVLINAAKAIADALAPKGADLVDLSYLQDRLSSNPTRAEEPVKVPRLPEIPLPIFDGDCRYWPSFHYRFITVLS